LVGRKAAKLMRRQLAKFVERKVQYAYLAERKAAKLV